MLRTPSCLLFDSASDEPASRFDALRGIPTGEHRLARFYMGAGRGYDPAPTQLPAGKAVGGASRLPVPGPEPGAVSPAPYGPAAA